MQALDVDTAAKISGVMDDTQLFRIATVPEPITAVMFAVGIALLAGRNRRA